MKLKKQDVVEANKILCQEFGQQGVVINDANLDFAVDGFNEKEITKIDLCRKIVQGHCFLDGNKRLMFILYLYLNKVENSKNPLVTFPIIGISLINYTRRMLQEEPWRGILKLLSEL